MTLCFIPLDNTVDYKIIHLRRFVCVLNVFFFFNSVFIKVLENVYVAYIFIYQINTCTYIDLWKIIMQQFNMMSIISWRS